MRVLRVAAPYQLPLGLLDLPTSGCRWQAMPEDIRCQVLALLARLIAKGALVDPESRVVVEVGDA